MQKKHEYDEYGDKYEYKVIEGGSFPFKVINGALSRNENFVEPHPEWQNVGISFVGPKSELTYRIPPSKELFQNKAIIEKLNEKYNKYFGHKLEENEINNKNLIYRIVCITDDINILFDFLSFIEEKYKDNTEYENLHGNIIDRLMRADRVGDEGPKLNIFSSTSMFDNITINDTDIGIDGKSVTAFDCKMKKFKELFEKYKQDIEKEKVPEVALPKQTNFSNIFDDKSS